MLLCCLYRKWYKISKTSACQFNDVGIANANNFPRCSHVNLMWCFRGGVWYLLIRYLSLMLFVSKTTTIFQDVCISIHCCRYHKRHQFPRFPLISLMWYLVFINSVYHLGCWLYRKRQLIFDIAFQFNVVGITNDSNFPIYPNIGLERFAV